MVSASSKRNTLNIEGVEMRKDRRGGGREGRGGGADQVQSTFSRPTDLPAGGGLILIFILTAVFVFFSSFLLFFYFPRFFVLSYVHERKLDRKIRLLFFFFFFSQKCTLKKLEKSYKNGFCGCARQSSAPLSSTRPSRETDPSRERGFRMPLPYMHVYGVLALLY